MMKFACIALALVAAAYSTDLSPAGPSYPSAYAACDVEGKYAADSHNVCWYHQCVINAGTGGLTWIPRRCAWGTVMSNKYVEGLTNPCTVNLKDADVWGFNQCKRTETAMEMVPDCFADTHCENGGTAVYETNVCWCECPEDWQGDSDCSKPTMPYKNLPEGSDICIGGEPQADWCEMVGGCLNGGSCYNQCDTFWCDCGEDAAMSVDHFGKRCEIVGGDPKKSSYYKKGYYY